MAERNIQSSPTTPERRAEGLSELRDALKDYDKNGRAEIRENQEEYRQRLLGLIPDHDYLTH